MAQLNDTVKYLDLTGLGQYDAFIKEVIAAGDQAVEDKIDAAIGEGGNVATQIETAINNLKGTLSNDDAATLEAINDELDGIDSEISTLKGDATTAGSVAKAIKDKVDTLDYTIDAADHVAGRPVIDVSEADGIIAVTEGNIKADYVTVDWGSNDPVSATGTVQASLDEIYGKLADNAAAGTVTVENASGTVVNAIHADGTTYTIKQGTGTVATINIAQDMVVSSGSVITADGTETDVPTGTTLTSGEKYVRLVIANSTDGKNIYIPVNSLYKDHTAAANASKIQLAISDDNVISASVVTGSIEKTDLTAALQNEISSSATVVNAKSTGHVQVAVTPASGANPAEVTISESDIASAIDLSGEVTRAQSAETAIDGAVGLTKGASDETRTWTPTTNYKASGNTHTVANNMAAIDSQLKSVSDFIGNMTPISQSEIQSLFTVNSGE